MTNPAGGDNGAAEPESGSWSRDDAEGERAQRPAPDEPPGDVAHFDASAGDATTLDMPAEDAPFELASDDRPTIETVRDGGLAGAAEPPAAAPADVSSAVHGGQGVTPAGETPAGAPPIHEGGASRGAAEAASASRGTAEAASGASRSAAEAASGASRGAAEAASSVAEEHGEKAPPPERLRARFGRRFEAGDVIFREGELGTEAYLLEEGRVRLIKKVRGAERSLMVLKPGDLFGESALLPGAPRWSTAIALSRGVALALNQGTLQNLVERNPGVALRIVKQLVERLRDAEDQIEIMMLADTQSKVVSALLKLARQSRNASTTAGAASFVISPMELSTRVGLDVETVKRAVQQLRDGQYLRVAEERLEIPDLDALRRLYSLLGLKDEIRGEP